ncbi:MAG: hypothetical protein GY822_28400 [Deltaproteobacteria bacterium]|nr:hypothetical protein [Deltaproteobacteria bacterium]
MHGFDLRQLPFIEIKSGGVTFVLAVAAALTIAVVVTAIMSVSIQF